MRVSVGDVRLFFDVSGSGWAVDDEGLRNRPVLIGLHGGPGRDGSKHRYQLAQFADVAQVIVPDQRGHGRSDPGTPESWNLATWAADVKGLCDALAIERPVVFGSSFGGFVAQKYGSAFPEHPAGLILSNTAARIVGGDELVERFRVVGGDEAAEVARRDIEAPTLETQADWIRVCGPLLRLKEVSDPHISIADRARIETMEVNIRWFETEAWLMDLRADLANVRCPTLVLLGAHDPLNPIYTGEEIVAAIPNGLARLEVIPDAAHELMTDNPEQTSRCIRQFLADIAQPL